MIEPPAGEVGWDGAEACVDGPLRPATRYTLWLTPEVSSSTRAALRVALFDLEGGRIRCRSSASSRSADRSPRGRPASRRAGGSGCSSRRRDMFFGTVRGGPRRPFVARDVDVVLRPPEPYVPLDGLGGGGGSGGLWRPRRPLRLVAGPPPVIGAELDARGERRLELELPREAATFRVFAVASAPIGGGPGRFGVGEAGLRVVAARR